MTAPGGRLLPKELHQAWARLKSPPLPVRILLWTVPNSGAGIAIGFAVAAFREGPLDPRVLWVSVLFGNVVGFTAIFSALYIFPRWVSLPTLARLALQVATLVGVSVLGTGIVIATYPLFFLHEFRIAIRIFVVNGVVATIVGILLSSYETMRANLAESLRVVEEVQLKEADLRAQAARAQLAALQARINPHFFFNTLNTISSLIAIDPDRAEDTIALLADLFRYTLKTTGARLVPFADELGFVDRYLTIEKARFGERLTTTFEIPEECGKVPVPGLILQPIVENAVAHGIAARASGGRVLVQARLDDGALHVEVSDEGPGPGPLDTIYQDGHGLANVRDRIASLYGGQGAIAVTERPEGGTRVCLRLSVTPPSLALPVPSVDR